MGQGNQINKNRETGELSPNFTGGRGNEGNVSLGNSGEQGNERGGVEVPASDCRV